MTLTKDQKIAIAIALTAVALAYIQITKKHHLLCPVTYLKWLPGGSSSSSSAGSDSDGEGECANVADGPRFTCAELAQYDGTDPTNIYVAVKGNVYRVSPQYYGKGANYNCFAGTEASRNLGKGIIGKDEANADWRNLSPEHMEVLNSWEKRFIEKYTVVGTVVEDKEFRRRGKEFAP